MRLNKLPCRCQLAVVDDMGRLHELVAGAHNANGDDLIMHRLIQELVEASL